MNPQTEVALRGILILIGSSLLVKRFHLITDADLQEFVGYALILGPILWAQIAAHFRTRNIKDVQEGLGVKKDGIIGEVTIEAARNKP